MKKIATLVVLLGTILIIPTRVQASEGTTELRSTLPNRSSRCFVHSHLSQAKTYSVLVTCRDLIYPIDPGGISSYVMWSTPNEGEGVIKWGKLKFGKAFFNKGNKPFSNIFVTIETKDDIKKPTGPIVMQGSVVPVPFLDGIESTFTPTPEPEKEVIIDEGNSTNEKNKDSEEKSAGLTGFKRVSVIVAIVLMIGAIIALVLIQRSKKR